MTKTTSCAAYGAALGFMSVRDAVTVVHGSRSCQAMMFSSKSVREVGKHRFIPDLGCFECRNMRCTDMTERSAIFGGTELLQNKMEDLYRSGERNLFVTTTCAPGITGDDCKGVVRGFGKRHPDTRVGCVEASGNMTGDWEEGFVGSSEVLSGFIKDCVDEEDSVNILAERYFFYFRKDIDSYMTEILKDFDVKVNTRYLYRSTMPEIESMGCAGCDITAIDDYITDKALEHVERRIGRRRRLSAPIGFSQYGRWAEEMSSMFKAKDSLQDTLERNDRLHGSLLSGLLKKSEGKRALVYHEDTDRFDWQLEGLRELGMEVEAIAKKPNHGPVLSDPGKVKVHPAEDADSFESVFREFSPDIVVSDTNIGLSRTRQYASSDDRLVSERNDISFDVPLLKQFFPGVGVKGYSDFLMDVVTLIEGKGCGRWRSDRY